MTIYLKNKYTLKVDEFEFKCCIGKNGLSKNKIEGDKKTPVGLFQLGHLYLRKDRIKKPYSKLNKKNKFAKELFSKKYKPRVIKPKKGKGSFKRIKKF